MLVRPGMNARTTHAAATQPTTHDHRTGRCATRTASAGSIKAVDSRERNWAAFPSPHPPTTMPPRQINLRLPFRLRRPVIGPIDGFRVRVEMAGATLMKTLQPSGGRHRQHYGNV